VTEVRRLEAADKCVAVTTAAGESLARMPLREPVPRLAGAKADVASR
jgi:hypothetical protein